MGGTVSLRLRGVASAPETFRPQRRPFAGAFGSGLPAFAGFAAGAGVLATFAGRIGRADGGLALTIDAFEVTPGAGAGSPEGMKRSCPEVMG